MDLLIITVDIALAIVAISVAFCFYRVAVGPTIPDKVVALDTIAVNMIAIITLYSVKQNTLLFLDAVLVIAILGFLATVVMAKYLQRGDIVDRDSN